MLVEALADPLLPSTRHSEQADFFEGSLPSPLYSLAYDYTFFCALPPSMREAWAKRYSELLNPSALLLCLEFPIGGSL